MKSVAVQIALAASALALGAALTLSPAQALPNIDQGLATVGAPTVEKAFWGCGPYGCGGWGGGGYGYHPRPWGYGWRPQRPWGGGGWGQRPWGGSGWGGGWGPRW